MSATQARKHAIGMAGEFFVTAELLRRGLLASVSYGNAKKADVVALSKGKLEKITAQLALRRDVAST